MRDKLWSEIVLIRLDPSHDWSHDFMTLQNQWKTELELRQIIQDDSQLMILDLVTFNDNF